MVRNDNPAIKNLKLVILDEAHKARSRQGFGKDAGSPNELLTFIREIAARSPLHLERRRDDLEVVALQAFAHLA